MEFSGQEANKMKLRFCKVLIANIPSDKNMAVEGDNGNCLSTGLCNRKYLDTEAMIDLSGLKEEVNRNSRAIEGFFISRRHKMQHYNTVVDYRLFVFRCQCRE